jgi:hypothetical protein
MNDEAETYFAPVVVPPPLTAAEREAIRAQGRARILKAATQAIGASRGHGAGEVDDAEPEDDTPTPPARVIPFPAPAPQPEPLTPAARAVAARDRVIAAFEKYFPPRNR